MPLYQQLIIARDIAKAPELTSLLKQCATTVLSNGGAMRGFENHGLRALSHRLRNRRAMEEEQKYHWRARYISSYFDVSPDTVKEVERVLRLDENVLRFFTLRPKTQADLIRTRTGFRAALWAEERSVEKTAEVAREEKRRLFHEEP
ncbi:hypothetical protein NSK_002459 [Nannochloropsis salina CCMP1776]|uniref:Ribosomal protein S6 n=1 Tax=Nannochloropsis salina CCMP1776 TaxID=1027361 RepID=A0A4D9D3F0_9STRA|nr:hypothetical protein NSK_002459 [Nannochloropsis salina CCMP1776]|eukprot:TFJ86251.1 hypothetical protein NSK_002459 [Nannochloropsis salina CCMP1776]